MLEFVAFALGYCSCRPCTREQTVIRYSLSVLDRRGIVQYVGGRAVLLFSRDVSESNVLERNGIGRSLRRTTCSGACARKGRNREYSS